MSKCIAYFSPKAFCHVIFICPKYLCCVVAIRLKVVSFVFSWFDYTFTDIHFCFSTLTATVIVPSQDKPCSQWVSFNTEHEPVLNNAPVNNDACDNFLKRLQKTKLSSQGKIQTLGTANTI